MRVIFVLGFVFGLFGCWGVSEDFRGVRMTLSNEPATLDPSLAEDGTALRILANTSDGLMGYSASGKLQLRLARSVRVSTDHRQFEFDLREGVLWSDGVEVKPEDFVTGVERTLSPQTAARLGNLLLPIEGSGKFRASNGGLAGLKVRGRTLIVRTAEPAPYFVHAMTLPVALPQRKDVLERAGGVWPKDAPVTGAYTLREHRASQRMEFQPNPKYWAYDPAALPIRLMQVPDESTGLNLFEAGKLELLTRVPALDFPKLQAAGRVRVHPFRATYYLAFNVRKAPFDRVEWRRAVSRAIQKEEITRILGTGETPANSWVAEGLEGYYADQAKLPQFSAPGVWKESVRIGFDSNSRNTLILEKVQQDLKRLGLSVVLENADWKTYLKRLRTDPPQIYRFGWLAPFEDPVPHLEVFLTGNPNNYTGASLPRYDALVSRVRRMLPGAERERLIVQAQKILLEEEAIVIPLYHYVQTHMASPGLKGFAVNPYGQVNWSALRLE
jgi:oligopeptide transport system substrate-binding protein